jgi:hypothetical protein
MVTAIDANSPLRRVSWLMRLKTALGIDGAIAYSFVARSIQILGSIGTVLLIVHFLSPIEQGYYYALLSLAALQVIFELGFSTVIQQMAAHELVHLAPGPDGSFDTTSVAYCRLASVFKKTVRWYLTAGVLMVLTLLPAGGLFFHRLASPEHHVAWRGPWQFAAVACIGGFVLNPLYSFLEGCGQVRQVARMRLFQVAVGVLFGWTAMLTRHGLYSPALVMGAASAIGLLMLFTRRRFLVPLLRLNSSGHEVNWSAEVWPFQWRIAITSLCTYFTSQFFILILFAFRSPQEAGQMGMSISIAFYLNSLVGPWISTKSPMFGGFAAQKRFKQLDEVYFRTLRQSVSVLVALSASWEAGLIVLSRLAPKLGARMVSPTTFALLFLTIISTHIVISEGTYLRAFKREPFLFQSVSVALLTLAGCLLTARSFGASGIALSYFVASGVIGPLAATLIFRAQRAKNLGIDTMPGSRLGAIANVEQCSPLANERQMHQSSPKTRETALMNDSGVVVLADFRASAQEHCEINRFFLHFYRVTLRKSVHLFAEKAHVACLTRDVSVDYAGRFWKTYSRKRILVVFLREIMAGPRLLRVILHARKHRAEMLHILYLSQFAHLIARLMLGIVSPGCPVLLTMHGELEALLRKEKRFWKADFWLPVALRLSPNNLFPVLLGRSVRTEMEHLGFDTSRFIEIEHPYSFGDSAPASSTCQNAHRPLRVGSIGLASLTKGSELLYALADRFQDEIAEERISFCHIGRLHNNMRGLASPHVHTFTDGNSLDEAEYNRQIDALDAVLFFYPLNSYRLTASGALFDVIRHNKRMLTFPNSYFSWVLRKAPGDMVQYADDLGQMEAILRGWLVNMPPQPEGDPYAAVRREHSVKVVEQIFLDQLHRKVGNGILATGSDHAAVVG